MTKAIRYTRLALGASVIVGCAASIDKFKSDDPQEVVAADAISVTADLATVGLAAAVGIQTLTKPQPTIRRKTR